MIRQFPVVVKATEATKTNHRALITYASLFVFIFGIAIAINGTALPVAPVSSDSVSLTTTTLESENPGLTSSGNRVSVHHGWITTPDGLDAR